MHKVLKRTALVVVAVGVVIQFIRPDRTNPPVQPGNGIADHASLPSDVKEILDRSCFDCHSSVTRWPWYSQVAPVSWLVAQDVKEGRRHLNFSEWQGYKPGIRRAKLEAIIDEMDNAEMPPATYLVLHRDAALLPAERERIAAWAGDLSDSLDAAKDAGS